LVNRGRGQNYYRFVGKMEESDEESGLYCSFSRFVWLHAIWSREVHQSKVEGW